MQFLQAIKGACFSPFVVMRSAIGWAAFITGMAGIYRNLSPVKVPAWRAEIFHFMTL